MKDADGPRTRGGWRPVGTAAARRAARDEGATARGDRTRDDLVAAARQVFEQKGYAGVRVADVVGAAGVAHGSFYTYFSSKREIFLGVARHVGHELEQAAMDLTDEDGSSPRETLHVANRRYLEHYRRNGVICALFDQVALTDDDVHEIWRNGRRRHIDRVTTMIEGWQAEGLADETVDAQVTAGALVSMSYTFAYWWFETAEPAQDERAARALTDIWVRSVGLRERPKRSRGPAPR